MKIRIYRSYGFTLVELIVTVAIMAIILTIAYPHIMTLLANMEAKRIRYEIVNTLKLAKSESYIQRQNVVVCLSDDNRRCEKDSNNALLLFFDKNNNQQFDSAVDVLIEEQRLKPKYGSLHLRAGQRHYVRFAGDSGNPRGFFGHIKYCPRSIYNQSMYQISFNQAGIIKYKPDSKSQPTKCSS